MFITVMLMMLRHKLLFLIIRFDCIDLNALSCYSSCTGQCVFMYFSFYEFLLCVCNSMHLCIICILNLIFIYYICVWACSV